MKDIVLNKKESIERCVRQIRKYYAMPSELPFKKDYIKQDAILLNLQRACEQSIDLANHVIKTKKLGLPKESKESFEILAREKAISEDMSKKLQGMVGFRNTAIHEYQELNLEIVVDVIENHLDNFIEFTNQILGYINGNVS